MNKKDNSQILDQAARDHLAKNTDLAPQILNRIQKGKSVTMQSRRKVFATILLVLFALAITTLNVPSVKAAIQRLFGYIPGAGLVSDGQIRMLAEPVSDTRNGVTLTVKQVWATVDKTVVRYSIEGWERKLSDTQSDEESCYQDDVLRLEDRDLAVTQAQTMIGWEDGYEIEGIYAAIPATVDEVTLVVPCAIPTTSDASMGSWEVPLQLVSAPADMTVYPVIENAAPVETSPAAQPQTGPDLSAEGLALTIDRAVEMDDGYLLFVTMDWRNTGLDWIEIPDPAALHLSDADGQSVPYHVDYEATNPLLSAAPAGQSVFAIQTESMPSAGPLTLTLDTIAANIKTKASFTFDPGSNPEPGQTWELKQDIDVGFGHSLRVLNATYNLIDDTLAELNINMESETGILHASLFDPVHPMAGVAGDDSSVLSTPGSFTSSFYYETPLPRGPLTIEITAFSVNLPGHWQTTWAPPES
jgi:hypothetical protein